MNHYFIRHGFCIFCSIIFIDNINGTTDIKRSIDNATDILRTPTGKKLILKFIHIMWYILSI